MRRKREQMKTKIGVLWVLAVGVWTLSASAKDYAGSLNGLEWGAAGDGIRISLSLINPKSNELQVAIRNAGNRDVVINLGSMLANGETLFPGYIKVAFVDANGKTRDCRFFDETPRVAGRIDDYVVPLRVGSIYTLQLKMDLLFCSEDTPGSNIVLPPGKNRLTVQFQGTGAKFINLDTQGIKLMNFWLGTVKSNTLIIER
jgi:hypothetical protein